MPRQGRDIRHGDLRMLPVREGIGSLPVHLQQPRGHGPLRPHALDRPEAGQHLRKSTEEAAVCFRQLLLALRHLVHPEGGQEDRQQGNAEGDQRQPHVVGEHQHNGAREVQHQLRQVRQGFQITRPDGVQVIGHRRGIGAGVLPAEGGNVLAQHLPAEIGPVAGQRLPPERGPAEILQRRADQQAQEAAHRKKDQVGNRAGLIPGNRVQDLLGKGGKAQHGQRLENAAQQGQDQVLPVLQEQGIPAFPNPADLLRGDFGSFDSFAHDTSSFCSVIFPRRYASSMDCTRG